MIRKNFEKAFEMKDKLKQFHFPIVFYMTTQNLETAMGDISIFQRCTGKLIVISWNVLFVFVGEEIEDWLKIG